MRGLPRAPGVRYPVLVPNVRGHGPGRGRRRRRDRRLHRGDRCVHRPQHRHDGRRVAGGVRAGPRRAPPSSAGGGAATSRPPSAARTPAAVEPGRAVEVALRLLDLGVDEVCFGDTIGVGVPGQVAALTGLAVEAGIPLERIAFHFHDTRGTALANVAAGLDAGRPLLRFVGRRDRRLPVRAGRRRQSRHGGPRLLPRRLGLGARRLARRRARPPPGSSPTRSVGRSRPRSARPAAGTRRRAPRPGVAERQAAAACARARSGRSAIVRPMDGVVLVLNQNYEPLNVCNLPRAFRLVFGEKAEVIEYDHQVIRTPRTEYRAPSVIRLQYLIRRPRPRVKLSRREVFARDRHTCQYCGRQSHDLTLDHVDAAPSRRRPHLGEPRRPRASRATTARAARRSRRRGSACFARRSSRAATSTRCSRHTSATSATRHGAPTCSWVATDGPSADGAIEAAIPAAVRRPAGDALGGRSRRVCRRWVVARRRPRARARRLGPRLGGTAGADRRAVPGRRLREPVRDGGRPARRPATSRSRPSASTTTTRTSAGRTTSSSARRSRWTSPAAIHGQRDGLGRGARERRPRCIDPYGGALDRASEGPARRRRAARPGSRRTRCG